MSSATANTAYNMVVRLENRVNELEKRIKQLEAKIVPMVERLTEDHRVGGSSPSLSAILQE